MPFKLGVVSVFAPLNFAVLFGLPNLRNKGHVNIKGFTVCTTFRRGSCAAILTYSVIVILT